MNNETLWKAIGEVGADLVLEAEVAPKRTRKKRTAIILAAALVALFSVTAIANQYRVSFEEIFCIGRYDNIKDYENIIGTETYSEEKGIRFSAVSAFADDRVCLLLWQIENTNGAFKKGYIESEEKYQTRFDYTSADVYANIGGKSTSTNGYRYDDNMPANILTGYNIVDIKNTNETKGSLYLKDLGYSEPVTVLNQKVDFDKAIAECEYIESEAPAPEGFSREFLPQNPKLGTKIYDYLYLDFAHYEDKTLTVAVRSYYEGAIFTLVNGGVPVYKQAEASYTYDDGSTVTVTQYYLEQQYFGNIYYEIEGYRSYAIIPYIYCDLSVDFSFKKRLPSTVLKTADPDIEIVSSPISLSIKGNLPEYETLELVFEDGSCLKYLTKQEDYFVTTHEPFNPEEIVSVLYNGEELLA